MGECVLVVNPTRSSTYLSTSVVGGITEWSSLKSLLLSRRGDVLMWDSRVIKSAMTLETGNTYY